MKSWIEISSARLVENLRAVEAVAGAGVETLAVIKANAYGHDAVITARVLLDAGVRWLGVTDVEEGIKVRSAVGISPRIMVMSGLEPADCTAIILNRLTPVVWTAEHIEALERSAEPLRQTVRVHLEIDTGMGRQGVAAPDLSAIAERLASSQWVACEGVMSHLSSAELAGSAVTQQQQRFAEALDVLTANGVSPDLIHLGNTSAVDEGTTLAWVRQTAKRMGAQAMVRTGLALYGYCLPLHTGKTAALRARLKPVLTWKTRLIGIRNIGVGETVGYGATFRATSPMRLGLLPVGYADGFRREGSSGMGNGWVMLGARRAAVVGRVSMNLTVVNTTDIAEAAVGDVAVLLGEGVSAEDIAQWSHTIAYDILCGIRAKTVLV